MAGARNNPKAFAEWYETDYFRQINSQPQPRSGELAHH